MNYLNVRFWFVITKWAMFIKLVYLLPILSFFAPGAVLLVFKWSQARYRNKKKTSSTIRFG